VSGEDNCGVYNTLVPEEISKKRRKVKIKKVATLRLCSQERFKKKS
jgi:hypothetical protein